MRMYYIGNNDNEFGFKYGNKYDVIPAIKNIPGYEQIGIVVRNCESYETVAEYFTTFEDIMNNFTCYEWNVDKLFVPKKPEKSVIFYCPKCGAEVEDCVEKCENCGQALDWEEFLE
ncbi:MAG: zinc ribbon domain-containing protein [Clostridia bacterium]|nr:zinc ribbon domain-containing protein [Clostridia bacterium]